MFVWEAPHDPVKETKEEKAAEVPVPKSPPNKEEDIHDLPSYRSNKSSAESKRSKDEDWCKCSVKSSKSSCSEKGAGDEAKRNSICSNQMPVKSKTSITPIELEQSKDDDQKSVKPKSSSICSQESGKSKNSKAEQSKKNTLLASTKTVKSLQISTPPSKYSKNQPTD